ncbi:cytosolic carboxypeptidase 6 [Ursus arctos]|nr:cytosolic carboxypeptidase 6 [Ursus arctos]
MDREVRAATRESTYGSEMYIPPPHDSVDGGSGKDGSGPTPASVRTAAPASSSAPPAPSGARLALWGQAQGRSAQAAPQAGALQGRAPGLRHGSTSVRPQTVTGTLAGPRPGLRDNLREGAEQKVVFITGRVHPGETPSSFVCQGIIDFLISQHPIARVLREHLVFKIAPMLNPDGVYLGNYRCSLMGFDLNRHWLDPSPWAHPTLHGVKQLIIQMYNDPKTSLEFYIDIHAHSTMMNGFMYGNIFEDEERFQRQAVFPKLLCQNAEDFSYSSTSFNRDAVKAGTGRRFLGGLLDHTSYCYTLEVSFYSYVIGGTTAAVPYTEEAYMKLGRNVARTFLDYYRLNPLVEKVAIPMPRLRKEKPPPYKHPLLRGPARNHPNGKGDKKSSVNHKDPSNSF